MVHELTKIGLYDDSAETRADVWRKFDGKSELPSLISALVQALARDTAPGVREAAAETLAKYRNDPVARDALVQAAQHDIDEKVRKQASASLSSTGRGR